MKLSRRIASKYLLSQYQAARKSFEIEANKESDSRSESLDSIIDKVRRTGIAYAQTTYCFFTKKGAYYEDIKIVLEKDNKNSGYSLYSLFIEDMECFITKTINKQN